MNDEQLALFRATCFGSFLDIPKFEVQCQVIHSLLLRELKHSSLKEMWFNVCGVKLRFGLDEFAVITGLNCVPDFRNTGVYLKENEIVQKYFSSVSKINKQSIQECFFAKRWENDEDCLKIAVLYFLEMFLFSDQKNQIVSKQNLDLVASGSFQTYAWGKDVFDFTLDSLKRRFVDKRKLHPQCFYRLNGFPYAFQLWFYECCHYVVGKICDYSTAHVRGGLVPRMLNYTCSLTPSFKTLQRTIFRESSKKVIVFIFILFYFYFIFL